MSDADAKPRTTKADAAAQAVGERHSVGPVGNGILQVEKRDFTALVPEARPRAQSLNGFEDCYTDIVDYIVRSTHRIWDERNPGLIYTHYASNAVVYGPLGTSYDREAVVRATVQRLVELPDRRGLATQVIWRGDDVSGFYTSHLITNVGRHTEPGPYGKPTGRRFASRTIADCMIFENRVYREWLVRDSMAVLLQLGVDRHAFAERLAREQVANGIDVEVAENARLWGQYPPEEAPDLSLAGSDTERDCLGWLHTLWNRRMFGTVRERYAPGAQWHGPLMKELYGPAAITTELMRLAAMIPDLAWTPHHICSLASVEGGEKVAVRWTMDGHHLGHGSLGAPTGHRLFVMGMSHFHVVEGRVMEEWTVWDELALLTQVKLGALAAAAA